MSLFHYYVIELDLPEVSGTCTINGNPGFSTPLTCTDQNSPTIVTKTHKFTDTSLILPESDIYKCVTNISETTPKLKSGNGVASRATCNITVKDFTGDPNLSSPALTANSALKDKGQFFGKLKARNILSNKPIRVLYYESDGINHTLVKTNHYLLMDLKQSSQSVWVLTCKDVLYKADDENSDWPRIITGTLQSDITEATTSITMDADIAEWTPYDDYTAVVGGDLLMITNATGTSSSVTLTVVRAENITLGARTIINVPSTHSAGDEVFRGRKFIDADPYDVLVKVFEDADLTTDDYDGPGIESELAEWLPNMLGSVDAIFYEHEDTTSFLDDFCASFMLDIWTDTSIGKIVLKATTPWNTTVAVLTEGVEITYGSISFDENYELFYSRAFLQYDKRHLTESDDDANFARSSLAYDTTLEGDNFYGSEKVKDLGKSIILSNKTSNIEAADLTTVRYAQRFSNRPEDGIFEIEEANLNFKLGDVVEVISDSKQDFYGNSSTGVRVQVTKITPVRGTGRKYKVSFVTYNPFIGGSSGTDLQVNSEYDNNLYTIAGGPVSPGTFTFIFSREYYGQNTLSQAITVGSFPSGSVLNLVFTNGSIALAKGGDGGTFDGNNGGTTFYGASGVEVNIYLSGTTPDFGNGTYSADGYLFAPGGGGGGEPFSGDQADNERGGVHAGSGGAGNKPGIGGTGYQNGTDGRDGTRTEGGESRNGAGAGGGIGEDGEDSISYGGEADDFPGGLAGKAIVLNGATVNVYTNGDANRFINGSGDTPTSLS